MNKPDKQNKLVFWSPELVDHYCVKGDPPCPDRVPSGGFYKGPVPTPRDAHIRCKTCRWAEHCFTNDGQGGSELDVPETDDRGDLWDELDHHPYTDPDGADGDGMGGDL